MNMENETTIRVGGTSVLILQVGTLKAFQGASVDVAQADRDQAVRK